MVHTKITIHTKIYDIFKYEGEPGQQKVLPLKCPALRELLEVFIPKMAKTNASMKEAATPGQG